MSMNKGTNGYGQLTICLQCTRLVNAQNHSILKTDNKPFHCGCLKWTLPSMKLNVLYLSKGCRVNRMSKREVTKQKKANIVEEEPYHLHRSKNLFLLVCGVERFKDPINS